MFLDESKLVIQAPQNLTEISSLFETLVKDQHQNAQKLEFLLKIIFERIWKVLERTAAEYQLDFLLCI